jgi:hypothetical protein
MIDMDLLVVYNPSLQVVHHEEKEGRNHRAIHCLCLRSTMYTVVARYPFFAVPPAPAIATVRWIRLATS